MSYPQGINFRATSGYVTDGANQDPEVVATGLANYPRSTAQGNLVGFTTNNDNPRDRLNTNDPRLAGSFTWLGSSGGTMSYRFTLPSTGNYNIRIAAGDATNTGYSKVEVFDDTSSLGVLCNGSTGAANSFFDAAGNIRTATDWVANNTAVTKTFTTTVCIFKIGDGSNNCNIAHLYVESASGVFSGSVTETCTASDRQAVLQILTPATDGNKGNWTASTGSNLAAMLDETPADDGDYIVSGAAPTNDLYEVKLSSGSNPAVTTDHVLSYRIAEVGTGVTCVVGLYQGRPSTGGTLITSWTHNGGSDPLTGSLTRYDRQLTTTQAGNITDATDIWVRFNAS